METLNFMFYDLLNLLNDALNGGKDANLAFLAGRISWKAAEKIEQAAVTTIKKASAKLVK